MNLIEGLRRPSLARRLALLAVGARVYEGSLLRTNGKTSWATAWRSRTTG